MLVGSLLDVMFNVDVMAFLTNRALHITGTIQKYVYVAKHHYTGDKLTF